MKFIKAVMFVLVFIMIISPAISEADIVTVQAPEEFRAQKGSFEVQSDGRILVCGSVETTSENRAAMYIFDAEGNITDLTPARDRLEGLYRDAFFIDDNAMIALRSVPNEFTWRIARLENGEIIWTTEKTENVFDLERIGDKFFVYCKPEPVTAEIRCMDFDGNEEWKIRLEERITLEGMLLGEDMHIAYGSKMEDPIGDKDQRSTSLAFAFDNNGNILWRHDGTELGFSTRFIDAAWASSAEVILLGVHGIHKYDMNGEIWKTEISDTTMAGIISFDGAHLVASSKYGESAIWVYEVDEGGAFSGEYHQENVPSGQKEFLTIGGTPCMVLYDPLSESHIELLKIEMS